MPERSELIVVPQERFHGLDGLRGVLALIVCMAHGYTNLVRPYTGGTRDFWFYFVVMASRFAVLGFFAVSGFVIAYSIHQNQRRNGEFDASEFALSRVARIAPPLLAAIVLTWGLAFVLLSLGMVNAPAGITAEREVFWPDALSQMLAVVSIGFFGELSGGLNGPLWSLAYEMQLYVFAALVALGVERRSVLWFAGVVVLATIVAGRATPLQLTCYVCFAAGSVMFHLRARATLDLMLACFVASVAAMVWADINNLDNTAFALISQALFGAGFAVLIVLVTRSQALRAIEWTGSFSYTLYVVHFPIFLFAFYVLHPISKPWLVYGAMVLFCVVISALAALWLEDTTRWRALMRRA